MRKDALKVFFNTKSKKKYGLNSHRTRAKINPLEVDEDFDSGPSFTSLAYSRWSANDHRYNWSYLTNFLRSRVGWQWETVLDDIHLTVDSRSGKGRMFYRYLNDMVDSPTTHHSYPDLCLFSVDVDGYLRYHPRKKYHFPKAPITKVHWKDNLYFERKDFNRPPKEGCGCVCFKQSKWNAPEKCIHGNSPRIEHIWYLVTYKLHEPNEVWKLTVDEEKGVITYLRYRDAPLEIQQKPYETRRKVLNRKERLVLESLLKSN